MKILSYVLTISFLLVTGPSVWGAPPMRHSTPTPAPEQAPPAAPAAPATADAPALVQQQDDFVLQLQPWMKEYIRQGTDVTPDEKVQEEYDRQAAAWEALVEAQHNQSSTTLYYDKNGHPILGNRDMAPLLTGIRPTFYDKVNRNGKDGFIPHIFYLPMPERFRNAVHSIGVGGGYQSQNAGQYTGAVGTASYRAQNPIGVAPESSIELSIASNLNASHASPFIIGAGAENLGYDFFCDPKNAKDHFCLRVSADANFTVDTINSSHTTTGADGNQIWNIWADAGAGVKFRTITDKGAYCEFTLEAIGGGTYTTMVRKDGESLSGGGIGIAADAGCFHKYFELVARLKLIPDFHKDNENNVDLMTQLRARLTIHALPYTARRGAGLDWDVADFRLTHFVVNDGSAAPMVPDVAKGATEAGTNKDLEMKAISAVRVNFQ